MYVSYKDVMSLVGQKRYDGRQYESGDELPFTHREIVDRLQEHGFIGDVTRTRPVGQGTEYYAELTRLGAAMINEWSPEKFRKLNRRAGNYVDHVESQIEHEHRFVENEIDERISPDGSEITLAGRCKLCDQRVEKTFALEEKTV